MARIPLRAPAQTGLAPTQVQPDPNAFGAGVARALGVLAGAEENRQQSALDLAQGYRAQIEAQETFQVQRMLQDYESNAIRELETLKRSTPGDGTGFTNSVDATLTGRSDDLLGSIRTPALRRKAELAITGINDRVVLDAFNHEYATRTQYFRTELETSVNTGANDVFAGVQTYEEARAKVGAIIAGAALPDADKTAIARRAEIALQEALLRRTLGYQEFVDPGSTGLAPLAEAVEQVESAGDPGAVGPLITRGPNTGDRALGPMQVMPNTAMWPGLEGVPSIFDLARSAGIPVGSETKAEAERLLKVPELNRAFGRLYLGSLVRMFDGDVEAALIGYNAGPANARLWLNAGRDYGVLPDRGQTEPYVRNALAKYDPNRIFTDSRFDALPLDTKLNIQREAELEAHQRRVLQSRQEADAQDLFNEEVKRRAALDPEFTRTQLDGLLADRRIPYSVWNTSREAIERRTKDTDDLQRGLFLLQSGTTAIPGVDNEALDAVAGRPGGLLQTVTERSPGALQAMASFMDRVGMVPPSVAMQLRGMAQVGRPEEAGFAYGVMATLAKPPHLNAAFQAFGSDNIARATAFQGLAPYFGEAERLAIVQKRDLPKVKALEERFEATFEQEFGKNADLETFISTFMQTYMPLDAVDVSFFLSTNASFQQDVFDVGREAYVLAEGQDGVWQDTLAKLLSRKYGVTEVGGERRMSAYPPEQVIRPFQGTHDYVDEQVNEFVPETRGRAFYLQGDDRTFGEVRALEQFNPRDRDPVTGFDIPRERREPSWRVWIKDDLGIPRLVMRQDDPGQPVRMSFEITPIMREYEQAKTELDNLADIRRSSSATGTPEVGAEFYGDLMSAYARMQKAEYEYANRSPFIMAERERARLGGEIQDLEIKLEQRGVPDRVRQTWSDELAESRERLRKIDAGLVEFVLSRGDLPRTVEAVSALYPTLNPIDIWLGAARDPRFALPGIPQLPEGVPEQAPGAVALPEPPPGMPEIPWNPVYSWRDHLLDERVTELGAIPGQRRAREPRSQLQPDELPRVRLQLPPAEGQLKGRSALVEGLTWIPGQSQTGRPWMPMVEALDEPGTQTQKYQQMARRINVALNERLSPGKRGQAVIDLVLWAQFGPRYEEQEFRNFLASPEQRLFWDAVMLAVAERRRRAANADRGR